MVLGSANENKLRAHGRSRVARRLSSARWLVVLLVGAAALRSPAREVAADEDGPLLVAREPDWDRPFRHRAGSAEKDWIFEVNGSGLALLDVDEDGDLDVYLVNCGRTAPGVATDGAEGSVDDEPETNRLYENLGAWRFRDRTVDSGLGDAGWGSGAAVADVDNDGHLDVFVTNLGPNALHLGDGAGRFRRVESGAEGDEWSTSASFIDIDRDGLVDLYVVNYLRQDTSPRRKRGAGCVYKGREIFCGPGGLVPAQDRLHRNLGGGRFEDVSEAWGVSGVAASYGLGSLVVDADGDGYEDVFVANDTRRNLLFLNDSGKRFREAAVFLGLAYNDFGIEQAGMGLASADLNGDGRPEIFVTNFEDDTNTLHVSDPASAFWTEETSAAGLAAPGYRLLGWGTFFFDVDADGDLDLFVANGHVAPQVEGLRVSRGYRQPDQLFLQTSPLRFEEVPARIVAPLRSSRGAAWGDLDGDGDVDVVVNAIDEAPIFLENRAGGRHARFRLRGTRSNRAAIGASIQLELDDGSRRERRLQSGASFASHGDLTASFGLGADRQPRAARVRWPSGVRERFDVKTASKSPLELVEGEGVEER